MFINIEGLTVAVPRVQSRVYKRTAKISLALLPCTFNCAVTDHFALNIRYDQKSLPALVTMKDQGFDMLCSVTFLNTEMDAVLPDRRLIFSLAGGLQLPGETGNGAADELLQCVSSTIAQHYLPVRA